jgi:uncharacterized protein YrrD
MMSFRQVRGERVVSNDDAQQLGNLAHLVVDPSTRRLTEVAIDGGKRLVPWADVVAFGPDAIMVANAAGVHAPKDDRAKHDLLDRPVLSDRGNDCGVVDDVEFNPETGELLAIVTEQGHVEPDRVLAVGHYAVVIEARADTEVSGL